MTKSGPPILPPAEVPTPPSKPQTHTDDPKGIALVLAAYVLWGLFPFYMKALSHVMPLEVVAHRVIWSVPVAWAVLWYFGRIGDLKAALTSPSTVAMASLTAFLITANWSIYIWSIGANRAMEAALGYYLTPIFSVVLARTILKESLSRLQWTAVALAGLGVFVMVFEEGVFPVAGLGLMASFGLYSLAKKRLPIGATQGFLLEVMIMTPPAVILLWWIGGDGAFGGTPATTWLLVGCGVVTATPLLFFSNGARLIRLSTTGIMQFLTPTMIFLIAVFAFEEPFPLGRLIAFAMIWSALVLYCLPLVRRAR